MRRDLFTRGNEPGEGVGGGVAARHRDRDREPGDSLGEPQHRRDSWLYDQRERLAERRNSRSIAKTAIACKLITLVYYGLRDGEIRCLQRAA